MDTKFTTANISNSTVDTKFSTCTHLRKLFLTLLGHFTVGHLLLRTYWDIPKTRFNLRELCLGWYPLKLPGERIVHITCPSAHTCPSRLV